MSIVSSESNLRKTVILLAWPVVVRMFLNMVVNLVDMIMIGRLGADAIAAVGVSNQLFFSAIAAIAAFSVGTTTLVAQYTGAGDKEGAREVARQSLIFSAIITFSISIVGFYFAGPIINSVLFLLDDGGENILVYATAYFGIISLSISLRFLLIIISGIFQGVGDTKTPLYIMILTNIINVGGNYLLIFGIGPFPELGVTGAAIATAFSGMIGGGIGLILLFNKKRPIYVTFSKNFKIQWGVVKKILSIGIPSGIEQVILHSTQVFLTVLVASLSATAVAANQILLTAFNITFIPGIGFAIAATTLVGQFQGAKNHVRASESGFETARLAAIAMSLVGIGFLLFPEQVITLFTRDSAVIEVSSGPLLLLAATQPFLGIAMAFTGGLRGAGDTRFIMYLIAASMLGVRLILTLTALWLGLGLFGVWLAFVLEVLFRSTLLFIRFRSGVWTKLDFVSSGT